MISVENVTRTYPRRKLDPVVALDAVSLAVEPGTFVAVVGPSGSGKSTLLYTMGALLTPTSGEVLWSGVDIYRFSPRDRARMRLSRVGFVFQTFHLIPYLDGIENVALPAMLAGVERAAARRKAASLLERLGLGERARHRPAELSVGERQRVAIARSLVNDPEVVLADEPTGNLDPAARDGVGDLLEEIHRTGRTVVLVSHDRDVARRASAVWHLEAGRIRSAAIPPAAGCRGPQPLPVCA